jgi:hypothetical protein
MITSVTRRLTPEQAIEKECHWCMNGRDAECRYIDCPLKNGKLNPLKKIRDYCLSCVPEQDMNGVKQCTGEILNLEELKKTGDDAWETIKAGLDHAAHDLKTAINNAVSKFK